MARLRQALLERGHDPRAAAVASIGCLRVADADLGDETDVAPAGTKRACKRLLGDAHAVGLGGIEAVDSGIERAVHGLVELRRVDRTVGAADFPAAEADGGNLQVRATELPVFHGVSSYFCWASPAHSMTPTFDALDAARR